VKFFQLYCARG